MVSRSYLIGMWVTWRGARGANRLEGRGGSPEVGRDGGGVEGGDGPGEPADQRQAHARPHQDEPECVGRAYPLVRCLCTLRLSTSPSNQ